LSHPQVIESGKTMQCRHSSVPTNATADAWMRRSRCSGRTVGPTHRDYTLRCASAGKPVYVEKPMGMNHAECLDMIAACRTAGAPLWVGYYRRALPRFLACQLAEGDRRRS
jgi:hypothetical protein